MNNSLNRGITTIQLQIIQTGKTVLAIGHNERVVPWSQGMHMQSILHSQKDLLFIRIIWQPTRWKYVRFEVFTVVTMKNAVFWDTKTPLRTSQQTHYVSATEPSQLMLCKIWGFHSRDYEEWHLLGRYDILHSHRRENLKSYVVFLYGEATRRYIRRLETLRTDSYKSHIA
jgi:hypothetical protein